MINSLGYIFHWKNSESKDLNFLKAFINFDQTSIKKVILVYIIYPQQYTIIIEINVQCRKLENIGKHKE